MAMSRTQKDIIRQIGEQEVAVARHKNRIDTLERHLAQFQTETRVKVDAVKRRMLQTMVGLEENRKRLEKF